MLPMVTNYCTREGFVTQRMKDYFEERAKGGVALIIVGGGTISYPIGLSTAHQLGLYDDRLIPGLRELVEITHNHGCKIAFQVHHAGHRATSRLTGNQPVSASEIPTNSRWVQWIGGELPRALATSEVQWLVEAYVSGAARAKAVASILDSASIGTRRANKRRVIGSRRIKENKAAPNNNNPNTFQAAAVRPGCIAAITR